MQLLVVVKSLKQQSRQSLKLLKSQCRILFFLLCTPRLFQFAAPCARDHQQLQLRPLCINQGRCLTSITQDHRSVRADSSQNQFQIKSLKVSKIQHSQPGSITRACVEAKASKFVTNTSLQIVSHVCKHEQSCIQV